MLKSMTGFGRGEGETTLGKMGVAIRSINHRYSDINLKVPRRFNPLEGRIKEMIRSEVARGRIDVAVKLDTMGEGKIQFDVDLPFRTVLGGLQVLKERFHLPGEITLEHLAGAKDLITAKEGVEDVEAYWPEIVAVLKQSLRDMDQMKRNEGISLGRGPRATVGPHRPIVGGRPGQIALNAEGLSGAVQGKAPFASRRDGTGSRPLPARRLPSGWNGPISRKSWFGQRVI